MVSWGRSTLPPELGAGKRCSRSAARRAESDRRWLGERLAAHGIPALVVGYFHAPGLPDRLKDIPLEYFRAALAWLDRRPEVDAQRVSLLGVSYGSEAALLLAAHYPNLVHGVAALVPSSVVTCGTIGAGRGGFESHACIGSPWTFAGKPLPYAAVPNKLQPAVDPQAVIPVERIPSPVFLACGGRDQIWNSCRSARAIVARRNAHGRRTDPALCLSGRRPLRRHAVTGLPARIPGRRLLRSCG